VLGTRKLGHHLIVVKGSLLRGLRGSLSRQPTNYCFLSGGFKGLLGFQESLDFFHDSPLVTRHAQNIALAPEDERRFPQVRLTLGSELHVRYVFSQFQVLRTVSKS
jgi:hypothetical protein